ncbi:MAG: class I SAM-dependent methyltransferase [Stackebrandtia sp.]
MSNVRAFYDDLADTYDQMFGDWDVSMARQAAVFGDLIGASGQTILDCSCGIGTQAIGLAARGHQVTATDISPVSVARARSEAAARGVALATAVADMRSLPFAESTFEIVLCADNALCHLPGEAEALTALRQLRRVLRPGGTLMASIRDYDELRRTRPEQTPAQLSSRAGERCVTFQLWHWHADGEGYDLEHFQVRGAGDSWRVERRASTLWALTRAELTRLAEAAGFATTRWLTPAESGFYQPILMAS